MSTLIEFTEQELTELKSFTNEADAVSAVRRAMSEYLRFARRMQLKDLSGQVQMDETWQVLEAAELRDSNGGARPGTG